MQKNVPRISFIGLIKVTIGAPKNKRIELFSQAPSDSDENHHEIPPSQHQCGCGTQINGQYALNIFLHQYIYKTTVGNTTGQRYLLCTNRDGCDQ